MTCRNTTGLADPDLCSKYCADHPYETVCDGCGDPMTTTYARAETLGHYHSGCFGWPPCGCETSHRGECSPEAP